MSAKALLNKIMSGDVFAILQFPIFFVQLTFWLQSECFEVTYPYEVDKQLDFGFTWSQLSNLCKWPKPSVPHCNYTAKTLVGSRMYATQGSYVLLHIFVAGKGDGQYFCGIFFPWICRHLAVSLILLLKSCTNAHICGLLKLRPNTAGTSLCDLNVQLFNFWEAHVGLQRAALLEVPLAYILHSSLTVSVNP